ncbi:uracil-DNA glycosylase family protein [Paracoccus albicereus]|uniref:uracil-DNA glycosylase family protein n=1 Tax=Paracoccus albicereus TaxID=2922394 RepID=UPI00350E5443
MSYLLRAFAGLAPADVRVIVIGQDPYPSPLRATGRAFEDGAVPQVEETASPSLRRLVQVAAADLLERADLAQADAGWNAITQEFTLPSMSEMFDGLASQGVIFLNAAWTFTGEGPEQLRVNLRVWRPVMRQVVRQLILDDPNRVILALGAKARDLFNSRCPRPAHFVHHCHPQERGLAWFRPPNPLTHVNNHLSDLQRATICWLPGLGSPWPPAN